MSTVLQRMLQRATHPGGGLEPLCPVRVPYRNVVSLTSPVEDVEVTRNISRQPATHPAALQVTSQNVNNAETTVSAMHGSRDKAETVDVAASHSMMRKDLPVEIFAEKNSVIQSEPSRDADDVADVFVAEQKMKQDSLPVELYTTESYRTERATMMLEGQSAVVEARRSEEVLAADHSVVPAAPVIEISIGHIEVQAPQRAPERVRMPAFRPRVSLSDFLARGGRR